jgi:hypothetical protein
MICGFFAACRGNLHSCVTPTIWLPAPSWYSVSVALGKNETMRTAAKKLAQLKNMTL